MRSHSVTCHPAEVTFPLLPQPKLVLDLATPEGCKGISLKYGRVRVTCHDFSAYNNYIKQWKAKQEIAPRKSLIHGTVASRVIAQSLLRGEGNWDIYSRRVLDVEACTIDRGIKQWRNLLWWPLSICTFWIQLLSCRCLLVSPFLDAA